MAAFRSGGRAGGKQDGAMQHNTFPGFETEEIA
jgi:hypothetical protein